MTTKSKHDITSLNEDIFGKIINFVYPSEPIKCYKNDIDGNIIAEYIYLNESGSLHYLITSNKGVYETIKSAVDKMARSYHIVGAFQTMYNNYRDDKECRREQDTLVKMIKKLWDNREIKKSFYESMDTRSLRDFMKSIDWGDSYNLDNEWVDILAPNRLQLDSSLWTDKDEIAMVKLFSSEFNYMWLGSTYYSPELNTLVNDAM